MFIVEVSFLCKNKYRKKAESRYQQAFDTFPIHIVPEICRKDKGRQGKFRSYLREL
jgi:hypothetical protein